MTDQREKSRLQMFTTGWNDGLKPRRNLTEKTNDRILKEQDLKGLCLEPVIKPLN